MNVVGHDDEFVKKKFPGVAIVRERFDQEFGGRLAAEDR